MMVRMSCSFLASTSQCSCCAAGLSGSIQSAFRASSISSPPRPKTMLANASLTLGRVLANSYAKGCSIPFSELEQLFGHLIPGLRWRGDSGVLQDFCVVHEGDGVGVIGKSVDLAVEGHVLPGEGDHFVLIAGRPVEVVIE